MTVRNDTLEMRVTVFTARSQTSKKFTRHTACMRFIQKQVQRGNRVRFEIRPVGDWSDRTELLQGVPSHLKATRGNVGHLGIRPADTVISWCRRNLEHKEQLPAETDLAGYTNCTASQVKSALWDMEHLRNLVKPLPSYIGVPQRYLWLGSR